MRWLFAVWVGCHGSTVTTSSHMVGRLVTHDGAPVSGQRVQTVEAESRTAEDGGFQLSYKADAAYVHFVRDDVWYRRLVGSNDVGGVVDHVMPKTRSVALECPRNDCPLEFSWKLDGGWYAVMGGRCEPRRTKVYRAVPEGLPEITCRARRGSGEEPALQIEERGLAWLVTEVRP